MYASSSRQSGFLHTRQVTLVTWLNILVQVAFPLAGAFTPTVVSAQEGSRLVTQPADNPSLRTRVYTLGSGESVQSVAKRYNITPQALRQLNQLRTFAHGFDNLKPGDELDVPSQPFPEVKWEDTGNRPAQATSMDEQATRVAGYASQAGSFFGSRQHSDAAASMARGIATGEASSSVEGWLRRFGTARVQLDTDRNFSLKNSQLDLLIPLWERPDLMVFTQSSIHRTDDRAQTNIGLGLRHFAADYMLGANTFFDYDISHYHYRTGVGAEYWRDYLKLSANGYMRLSDWRNSPDVVDYEARPANGWDIRTEGWLPAWPHLGGMLKYEQYYGNEVALFGTENRQKSPGAITAGVNYTPFPLLTLSAEQRQGQGGVHDTRFGIEVTLQPGMPWAQQVNPDAVTALRSLAGSRYELVERNNNIILEYRKKEVIRLNMTPLVTGQGGELKSLGVNVTSKYGYATMDWSAAAFQAAGGQLVADASGPGWSIVLPAYQYGAQAVNTYTLSAVAVDTQGNSSKPAQTQVTVNAPVVSAQTSTFTPANVTLPADGISTQMLILTTLNNAGQPADIPADSISINVSPVVQSTPALRAAASTSDIQVAPFTRKSPGVYTTVLTAGSIEGIWLVTPSVGGLALPATQVSLSNTVPDAGQSTFTASPDQIAANGTAQSTLTFTARDSQGRIISGIGNQLTMAVNGSSQPPAGVTVSSFTESPPGIYSATLSGTLAGKYALTPQYQGTAVGNLGSTVTLTTGAPVQASSSITMGNTTYVAGSPMRVTVVLKDTNNNPVTGAASLLTASAVTVANATGPADNWADNGSGSYTATYTAQTAGTGLRAALQLTDWTGPQQSVPYSISSAPIQENSAIAVEKTTYVAGSPITVRVTLKDTNNDPVTGAVSLLTASTVTVANATGPADNWTDNGSGSYSATYTAQMAGTDLRTELRLADWNSPQQSVPYSITAAAPVQANSAIVVDRTSYPVGGAMQVTVTLKDFNRNLVKRAASRLTTETVTVQGAVPSSSWTDNDNGSYTAKYIAQAVGTGLGATLQLTDWSGPQQSSPYSINSIIKSSKYGLENSGDRSGTFIISPPDYALDMRCGWIVDTMAGIGGGGGSPRRVMNLSKVSSIDVTTGVGYGLNLLGSLTFHYSDGTASVTCGSNPSGIITGGLKTERFVVPSNSSLVGYTVAGNVYVSMIQFDYIEGN